MCLQAVVSEVVRTIQRGQTGPRQEAEAKVKNEKRQIHTWGWGWRKTRRQRDMNEPGGA